ncbi:MAG: DUF2721 domain-containing protein [Limisphaerales bacterium]
MLIKDLLPVLQLAIGPVIVISGVGLVLLSMTNRYGRVIDRARALADGLRRSPGADSGRLDPQLQILARRARLLRLAILWASASLLLVALLIIALFLASLLKLELAALIVALFVSCMLTLIGSLILFIIDLNVSLAALDLEISSRE